MEGDRMNTGVNFSKSKLRKIFAILTGFYFILIAIYELYPILLLIYHGEYIQYIRYMQNLNPDILKSFTFAILYAGIIPLANISIITLVGIALIRSYNAHKYKAVLFSGSLLLFWHISCSFITFYIAKKPRLEMRPIGIFIEILIVVYGYFCMYYTKKEKAS